MRIDRASVFAGTDLTLKSERISSKKSEELPEGIRAKVGTSEIETIEVTYVVEQPNRKPLHPEVVARIQAAQALDVRVLKAVPRIGAYSIHDPHNEFYLDISEGEGPSGWGDRIHDVAGEIEARGVGFAQVEALGRTLRIPNSAEAWFEGLANAKDIHEERAIERAFGEWADGDAIAAHIAYGLDVFCSADVGNSNVTNSVLDPINRAWLTSTYGVRFMTFDDLLAILP